MKKFFIAGLFLLGCDKQEIANDKMYNIVYTRDHRTRLCFASQDLGSSYAVMANVPCTPEVERLIK